MAAGASPPFSRCDDGCPPSLCHKHLQLWFSQCSQWFGPQTNHTKEQKPRTPPPAPPPTLQPQATSNQDNLRNRGPRWRLPPAPRGLTPSLGRCVIAGLFPTVPAGQWRFEGPKWNVIGGRQKGRKSIITHLSGNKSALISRHVDPLHAAVRPSGPGRQNGLIAEARTKYSASARLKALSDETLFRQRPDGR